MKSSKLKGILRKNIVVKSVRAVEPKIVVNVTIVWIRRSLADRT
jgi:hypothetical protein